MEKMTGKFAIRLLIFAALLVSVNFLLDHAFKWFSAHNMVNRMMDRQFKEYDDTLTYLTMGNSHNCINTHILEHSFNYGSPGESYIQSYYKLKYILEKTQNKPEFLLLQSDISSFGPKISNRFEYNAYWIRYINFIEVARIKKNKDVLLNWLEGHFFSYAGNYKDVKLSILYRIKFKSIDMYHGYRPHRDYKNFADEKNRQQVAWDKAHLVLSKDVYFDPTIRIYFEKIMQLCQDHGVKVILVRFPEAREYYEEQAKIVPVDKLYRDVVSLASQYPVYQGILDYHDMFFGHPDYFFDPDHMNVKGSDLFSRRIADDLNSSDSLIFFRE